MHYVLIAALLLLFGCGSDDEPNTDPLVVNVNNANNTNNGSNNSNNANNANNEVLPDFSPYFALDYVMQVDIELAEADWDELRAQTRTFYDIIGGEDCLDAPVENVFTWFETTSVAIDGVSYPRVGIRKKGLLGSLSDTKPSLKLKFDRFVPEQRLDDIVERVTLNNSRQDISKMNTCLVYHVFRKAGLPAPMCNFARVSVNGEDMGIFVHVEDIKKRFLRQHFEDEDGNLYEGTLSDFRDGWWRTFEKKTNEEENDWTDIQQAVAAFEMPGDEYRDALDEIIFVDQFITFWSIETIVGHWDGYSSNRNNFFVYHEPESKFTFIPWGADAAFRPVEGPQSIRAQGGLAHRYYNDPVMQPVYLDRMRTLLDDVWDEAELNALIDEIEPIVQEHALPEEKQDAANDVARIRSFIADRKDVLLTEMEGPVSWDGPLPGNICWVEIGDVNADFATTWGTRDAQNPFDQGMATISMTINDVARMFMDTGAVAGLNDDDPNNPNSPAEIRLFGSNPGGALDIWLIRVDPSQFQPGRTFNLGRDAQAILVQVSPPLNQPQVVGYVPLGTLVLNEASMVDGEAVSGSINGSIVRID